jgi:hypothetical protein
MKTRKRFITPEQLYKDAYSLADRILESGYRPDVILVMWRGGSPVGIVVHEYLAYHGVKTWHTVIKASSYTGIAERGRPVLENIEWTLKKISRQTKVLLVDDILDTGATMAAVKRLMKNRAAEVRTATIYCRKGAGPGRRPDYVVRQTASWIVFPHELIGLSAAEIGRKGPHISTLLRTRRQA